MHFMRGKPWCKKLDLYDDVIGAFGSQIQRILTIGGDAEADIASNTRRANRFKPVVEFMGPFTLKGGAKHTILLCLHIWVVYVLWLLPLATPQTAGTYGTG
jgi:hypothetical protein